MNKKSKLHTLYTGELSDIPGRMESWTEYLQYFGDERWELTNESTDFSGMNNAESFVEPFTTEELVDWVLERDWEHLESEPSDVETELEDNAPRKLFAHGQSLLEIAKEEKAELCIQLLTGWLNGTWPPPPEKPSAPTIMWVTGVGKMGIWFGIWRPVFCVDTSSGPGYLLSKPYGGVSDLCLVGDSGSSNRIIWSVKITDALSTQLYRHLNAYDSLVQEKNSADLPWANQPSLRVIE